MGVSLTVAVLELEIPSLSSYVTAGSTPLVPLSLAGKYNITLNWFTMGNYRSSSIEYPTTYNK